MFLFLNCSVYFETFIWVIINLRLKVALILPGILLLTYLEKRISWAQFLIHIIRVYPEHEKILLTWYWNKLVPSNNYNKDIFTIIHTSTEKIFCNGTIINSGGSSSLKAHLQFAISIGGLVDLIKVAQVIIHTYILNVWEINFCLQWGMPSRVCTDMFVSPYQGS